MARFRKVDFFGWLAPVEAGMRNPSQTNPPEKPGVFKNASQDQARCMSRKAIVEDNDLLSCLGRRAKSFA
jgi:hypothetical protein